MENKIDTVAVLRDRVKEMREAAYTFGENSKQAVRIALDCVLEAIDALATPASTVAKDGGGVAAWMTEDGRVATDKTKTSCMAKQSAVNFNIPLVRAAPESKSEASAATQPATPPALAVQHAHDLLSKYCVDDLSNGVPATLCERIEELYSWYAEIINSAATISEDTGKGESEQADVVDEVDWSEVALQPCPACNALATRYEYDRADSSSMVRVGIAADRAARTHAIVGSIGEDAEFSELLAQCNKYPMLNEPRNELVDFIDARAAPSDAI